jgi:hypothetical protein
MDQGLTRMGFSGTRLVVGVALLGSFLLFGVSPVRGDGEEPRKEDAKQEEKKDDAQKETRQETKKEDRPVVDKTQVYFGKACHCKAPAIVDADRVYRSIAEYKQILDKKLTEKDAEYSMLLLKAGRKFRAAVEAAATDNANDLVANLGAVKWEGHTVPDLTDAALKKVEELAKANP